MKETLYPPGEKQRVKIDVSNMVTRNLVADEFILTLATETDFNEDMYPTLAELDDIGGLDFEYVADVIDADEYVREIYRRIVERIAPADFVEMLRSDDGGFDNANGLQAVKDIVFGEDGYVYIEMPEDGGV